MSLKKLPTPSIVINFPVVGVGASAGGLDAFKKLIRAIPADSGMAYVLVQHLAPEHESLLPAILSRETEIPVFEITDDISLAPNNIYIIPENKLLTVYDGKLKLEPRNPEKKTNLPIDLFFNSLAQVHKGFSRGVILSGTGFDGSDGLKTIKEQGGSTFVQNPESAAFPAMPQNAIRSGAADFILEVEEIPEKLHNIDAAYESNHAYSDDIEITSFADEDTFRQIIRILKLRTGNDFSHYKQPTIRRRIARRMVLTKREDPAVYLAFLREDKKEQDALFNDVLIPVSYFFRDTKIFDSLSETMFPRLLEKRPEEENIRIWVAGCSTGEEAYSIAIALHEFLADKLLDIKVQIFASDISENVITKARAAIYTRQEVNNVSEIRIKNYFSKIEGAYHINKEIRDMCIFAVHNFVKDPPFARMDIISCRNVLIYLDPFLQKKALTTFHYALKRHGTLFLGKSETVGQLTNLYEPAFKHQKIYFKKTISGNYALQAFERFENTLQDKEEYKKKKVTGEPDFLKMATEILFSKYTPAGVIISENKEIVHFHGDTSPFLLPSPGKPNFNIFKMLREGLGFELRNALLKVKSSNKNVIREDIILTGKDYMVNLEVIPLPNSIEMHYLVLFHKHILPIEEKQRANQRKSADQQRIKLLEAELEQLRDDIRRVTEDQEAANEELQSANEELLSNSEELQTLNEELETSTEELQSNNEELITVNDELMDRQEQLVISRLYAEAIVETIREPLIILDKNLRIKSANASFYKYFKTDEQDTEGRLLFDVGNGKWQIASLRDQLMEVHSEKLRLEDLEINVQFPEFGERVMLLNARPIINDGMADPLILLAIEDITKVRATNTKLTQNNQELEENNKELSSFNYIASHDLQEPLRKIQMFTKLFLDNESKTLSEAGTMYLNRIILSTERMQQLIRDLLSYSHISNIDNLIFEDTDITALFETVKNDLSHIIEKKKALITVSKMPLLKVYPSLMRQLILNIISNALKYSKPEVEPNIKIYSEIIPGREIDLTGVNNKISYCKIKIADNGIGFEQELADKIFEPFQRLHNKDKYEGTGIGLAICKKIVQKHKGYILAESKPNIGTVFTVYLPL